MMRNAFNPDNGPLTDMSVDSAELQAMRELFVGAIGLYKNPHSDRREPIDSPRQAIEISHLLHVLDAHDEAIRGHRGINPLVTLDGIMTPALVIAAGERAGVRFLEFFAEAIRNPRTRCAYADCGSISLPLAVSLGPVMCHAEHLAVRDVRAPALGPRRDVVGIHVFKRPDLRRVRAVPHGA